MINARKEFTDVALENPTLPCAIFTHDAMEFPKAINGSMRPLPISARKRIRNKCPVEKGVEHAVNGMMEKPIPHAGLVDVPRLWVGDIKCAVSAVAVRSIH